MSFFGCIMQLLLTKDFTFDISEFGFAVTSEAWLTFIDGVQLVPINLIMVALCPLGGEATAFAFYNSIAHLAIFVSRSISKILERYFNVTEESLLDPNSLGGPISSLTITAGLISLSGIFFLSLMPHSKEEVEEWIKTKSTRGGYFVVGMVCAGFIYAIVVVSFSMT